MFKTIKIYNIIIITLTLIIIIANVGYCIDNITINVISKIFTNHEMYREVIVPNDNKIIEFAKNEFLGENLTIGTSENDIILQNLEDNKVKLSKKFNFIEDCAGLLMIEKDLLFVNRIQLKQSIPQYFNKEIMDNVNVHFEFELPSQIIKLERDKKKLPKQFGKIILNDFILNTQSNLDIFYQFNNYSVIIPTFLVIFIIFAIAKFNKNLEFIILPVLTLIISFIFASIVILLSGESPFAALGSILLGGIGSKISILNTLLIATPLIFTGLAAAIAFKCNLFNIGIESQFIIGAFLAAISGYYLNVGNHIHILLVFIISALGSGIFAIFAGWLKIRFEVHEVISTIMLNHATYAILGYLVLLPIFKETGPNPQTKEILNTAILIPLFHRHNLNIGIFIAIIFAFVIWFLIYKTVFGFNLQATGLNINAAQYSGVNISKTILLTMFISGAIAGLGGAERVMGVYHKYNITALLGYGFDGLAIALLSKNHPLAVIISAILFGFLRSGGTYMNREIGVPIELVTILQATIIIFITSEQIVKNILNSKKN